MLTIYGATGYTGRLITLLLAEAGRPFCIAARDRRKLAALEEELRPKLPAGAPAPEVVPVGLEDGAALRELLRRSRAVISCAGPFRQLGPPMVEACLDAGCHYLDITGELHFMLATKQRDAQARERGVVIAHAVGFDVVPTDLLAHLATKALGETPDEVELSLWIRRARTTSGTRRSAAGMGFDPGAVLVNGEIVTEPLGLRAREVLFPGRDRPKRVGSVPLGDLATLPATTGTKNGRTYVNFSPKILRTARVLERLGRTPLAQPLRSIVARLFARGPEGPPEDERKLTQFAAVAEARRAGREGRAVLTGVDPYGLTAHTALHAAFALLDAPLGRGGWLSPMQIAPPESWQTLLERQGCQFRVSR